MLGRHIVSDTLTTALARDPRPRGVTPSAGRHPTANGSLPRAARSASCFALPQDLTPGSDGYHAHHTRAGVHRQPSAEVSEHRRLRTSDDLAQVRGEVVSRIDSVYV